MEKDLHGRSDLDRNRSCRLFAAIGHRVFADRLITTLKLPSNADNVAIPADRSIFFLVEIMID
jgi:hypothetical protein